MKALKSYYLDDWPLLPVIFQFFQFILKNNFSTFNNQLYLQKHGTAMGTKMSLSHVNYFMGCLEHSFLLPLPDDKTFKLLSSSYQI